MCTENSLFVKDSISLKKLSVNSDEDSFLSKLFSASFWYAGKAGFESHQHIYLLRVKLTDDV